MAMTQYARNRYIAYKKAANKYGVDYEELKDVLTELVTGYLKEKGAL